MKEDGDFEMGINVSAARSQASSISGYAADLRGVKMGLMQYKTEINQNWKSTEVQYVNQALDQIVNELTSISSELDSLSSDIVTTAEDIKREEDAEAARQAAAAEAARQAAMARSGRPGIR
ncbi:hypothetical protein ACU063_10850 [Paenibacillus sp. M.A.Huq-81]